MTGKSFPWFIPNMNSQSATIDIPPAANCMHQWNDYAIAKWFACDRLPSAFLRAFQLCFCFFLRPAKQCQRFQFKLTGERSRIPRHIPRHGFHTRGCRSERVLNFKRFWYYVKTHWNWRNGHHHRRRRLIWIGSKLKVNQEKRRHRRRLECPRTWQIVGIISLTEDPIINGPFKSCVYEAAAANSRNVINPWPSIECEQGRAFWASSFSAEVSLSFAGWTCAVSPGDGFIGDANVF